MEMQQLSHATKTWIHSIAQWTMHSEEYTRRLLQI